jgi:hypothetical protein
MDVDIDRARIDLEVEHVGGLALAVQHLGIGFRAAWERSRSRT